MNKLPPLISKTDFAPKLIVGVRHFGATQAKGRLSHARVAHGVGLPGGVRRGAGARALASVPELPRLRSRQPTRS